MKLPSVILVAAHCCIGAHATTEKEFINWHFNDDVGGPYETIFHPTNYINEQLGTVSDLETPTLEAPVPNVQVAAAIEAQGEENLFPLLTQPIGPQSVDFRSGLQGLKNIVEKAASEGKRLRPYGSRWSLSEVAYGEDYMIDTYGLNYAKIGIDDARDLTKNYQDERQELLTFVQGGVLMGYLYEYLFEEGLTLSTSGTLDGQTIAGAVSTGTHNAAISFGCTQDFVKGIHLVLRDETVFVQRDSDPVVTRHYLNTIGADRLITNDEMFNAAVLSLGTFGIIHGFLIEPEKLFRLQVQVKDFTFSEAKEALYDPQSIASLGFDVKNPSELPYHFHAFVNPYRVEMDGGVKVRYMEKVPLTEEELEQVKAADSPYEHTYYGIDALTFMGTLVTQRLIEITRLVGKASLGVIGDSVQRLIFSATSEATILAIMQYALLKDGSGFPLQLFGDPASTAGAFTATPISTTATEICTSLDDLPRILDLVFEMTYDSPTMSSIEIRYVKSSQATLATSKFGYISAYVEIASIDMPESRRLYEMVSEALEELREDEGINFTYHWGKVLPVNDYWIRKSYGTALDEWKAQRDMLLSDLEQYMFSNDYTDSLGLT